MYTMDELRAVDPEIAQCIVDESERQNSHIELIASENWVSHAVMAAMGSILTNKYAEGYPGKRYYGGCVHVDTVEQLAIDRAKKLFGCEYVNVQVVTALGCVTVEKTYKVIDLLCICCHSKNSFQGLTEAC